jgi:hypothetical protein
MVYHHASLHSYYITRYRNRKFIFSAFLDFFTHLHILRNFFKRSLKISFKINKMGAHAFLPGQDGLLIVGAGGVLWKGVFFSFFWGV